MRIITSISEMRQFSDWVSKDGKTVGFVPTMGFLHAGHMSLVKAAREECDIVIVSVFVNPKQFCPGEDLDNYPRDEQGDRSKLEENQVDVMFVPEANEMYPDGGFCTYVEVEDSLTNCLCGSSRPGHFRGVTTVVSKLFNIVRPSVAYFGQKDAQQAVIVRRMSEDLDTGIEIRVVQTVRDADGLALSSRNKYLSGEERLKAVCIDRALKHSEELIKGGERSAAIIRERVQGIIEGAGLKVEYVDIVNARTLEKVEKIEGEVLIPVAAFCGTTRLIDNIVV